MLDVLASDKNKVKSREYLFSKFDVSTLIKKKEKCYALHSLGPSPELL